MGDYRLLFLASFSSLAGLGLFAYAAYYRKSYTSSAFTNYDLGKKRIDSELLSLSELYGDALRNQWMIRDRLERDGEGGIPDDPQR